MSGKIECRGGGPSDGEKVPDQGVFWRIMATIDKRTGRPIPGPSGTYVQRQGVYQWEPDP